MAFCEFSGCEKEISAFEWVSTRFCREHQEPSERNTCRSCRTKLFDCESDKYCVYCYEAHILRLGEDILVKNDEQQHLRSRLNSSFHKVHTDFSDEFKFVFEKNFFELQRKKELARERVNARARKKYLLSKERDQLLRNDPVALDSLRRRLMEEL